MSEPQRPRTRQELYDRIRQTSREEFILEEMIRLGFWPAQGEMPEDPADEIRRRGEINRELQELYKQNRNLHNEEKMLKELRKRRMEESMRKRKETKERREKERLDRAASWQNKKKQDIIYLGEGVSTGLNNRESDSERLASYNLPKYSNASEIASAMGISIGQLRFLAFSRKTSKTTHYVRFKIPKKTGGERTISAPMPRLKTAQHWILKNILEKVQINSAAHGFCSKHSIVTNAEPHLGAEVIVNVDLKDFFPSISYRRIKGLFKSLGYSEAASTIFGLICTEPEVEQVSLDDITYYIATSIRHLPQGAPTSPALTNILCRRLDKRLTKAATELGFTYTRYADDLTFSAKGESCRNVCNILGLVHDTVKHEGLEVNTQKTRVLRKGRQQEVTGVVVNKKLSVCKKTLKKFRAVLFQIEKDGPTNKHWGHSKDVIASVQGFANFVYMVNPEKGRVLKSKVKSIIKKYGWQPAKKKRLLPPTVAPQPAATSSKSAEPTVENTEKKSSKKWWKLF
jgi:retron-type reverse transcriptase